MLHQGIDPLLPERIGRLDELAHNLWWSWNVQARELFRTLDYRLWRISGHNPVRQLREILPQKLDNAAKDASFLALYDSVMSAFDQYTSNCKSRFAGQGYSQLTGPVAYFSAEFAIHNSLPIYAGGLGILAGDTCKEASDLGLPLVGIGLMHPQGLFRQHITPDGWQEEIREDLDFTKSPINRVLTAEGKGVLSNVSLGETTVAIGAWRVSVGCVNIYLVDTNLEENSIDDRQLANHLYAADMDVRIRQEIVLGIGGVRILRALGIQPAVWHANEGHAAFMMLERIREETAKGIPLDQAIRKVQATTVFTTHTPLPAGHDVFSAELVHKYLSDYLQTMGISMETLMVMGQNADSDDQPFNMTIFALKTAEHRNAVSALHGGVARRMWHNLWPNLAEDDVPISHVTNGVHLPTWIAPELVQLYDRYLGKDWMNRHDNPELWRLVNEIPDEEFWAVRQYLKSKLMSAISERVRSQWTDGSIAPRQVVAMGALLHPEALTIGFFRRFASYKRPSLILRDMEILERILTDQWRPVQVIFAGKSHPADSPSKELLQQVYSAAMEHKFRGRIAFVEDYDMHMARYLTQGVDILLNTPRRLLEACGTSGMKASMNGVPNVSVLDGWWNEGYNGANGWAIGDGPEGACSGTEDEADAESLYRLLEEKIVPLYYTRDDSGLPRGWINLAKEAIRSVAPVFCSRRMLKEYIERMYMSVDELNR
jgi:starch phosphorylase